MFYGVYHAGVACRVPELPASSAHGARPNVARSGRCSVARGATRGSVCAASHDLFERREVSHDAASSVTRRNTPECDEYAARAAVESCSNGIRRRSSHAARLPFEAA